MSKARELLKRWTSGLLLNDQIYRKLKKETEDLLAEPEQEQEPVAWQYRTKPNWQENWSKWEDCRKESYEDYIRVPLLHNWLYETRRLYTSPQICDPLSDDEIDKAYAASCENYYELAFKDGVRFAENYISRKI